MHLHPTIFDLQRDIHFAHLWRIETDGGVLHLVFDLNLQPIVKRAVQLLRPFGFVCVQFDRRQMHGLLLHRRRECLPAGDRLPCNRQHVSQGFHHLGGERFGMLDCLCLRHR
ncbi:hypothetical protein D3C81_1959480 [compost metagenome]